MKTWMRWQNKGLESAMMKLAMKVSPILQELSLLTVTKISEWNPALEKIFHDMEKCDPMIDCILKFKHLTSSVLAPYAEMPKDLRQKAKRTRLTQHIKTVWEGKLPTPSKSHESQTPGAELPDVDMLPSSPPAG